MEPLHSLFIGGTQVAKNIVISVLPNWNRGRFQEGEEEHATAVIEEGATVVMDFLITAVVDKYRQALADSWQ